MLAATSSVILAAGCASTGDHARRQADHQLEIGIRSEMDRYGELAAEEPALDIQAQDGVVTLKGSVHTEKDREMIDTMVRNTGGVVAVNDEIRVLYPPTGAASGYVPAPVYTALPPGVTVPAPVIITGPAAVPGEYPNSRVHAATQNDQALASRLVSQLGYDTVPAEWCQNVTITASAGNVFLTGYVDNEKEHHAIVSSMQHCPGVTAVYDQLQVR
jgi:osmotically-inducible protein OsmY